MYINNTYFYLPVANSVPSEFQSSVVTSLAFSLLAELKCSKTCHWMFLSASTPDSVVGMCQIRALESPDPEASSDLTGFHATVNTSESCPDSVVTLLASISAPSSSCRFSNGTNQCVVLSANAYTYSSLMHTRFSLLSAHSG
jgi:hypothetical protein